MTVAPASLAMRGMAAAGKTTPDVPTTSMASQAELRRCARSIASAHYDYGRQLARRGYAVAVPCMTPFGERRVNLYHQMQELLLNDAAAVPFIGDNDGMRLLTSSFMSAATRFPIKPRFVCDRFAGWTARPGCELP